MAERQIEELLLAAQWAFEREEESARLYHNRAQLVLTLASAFLGLGVFRLGTADEVSPVLSPVGRWILIALLMTIAVLVFISAFFVLVGGWGRRKEPHVSMGLVPPSEVVDKLAVGANVLPDLLSQTILSHKSLATANERRRREVTTGVDFLLVALFVAVLAVSVYLVGLAWAPPPAPGEKWNGSSESWVDPHGGPCP